MSIAWYLAVSAIVFSLGVVGVITRRIAIRSRLSEKIRCRCSAEASLMISSSIWSMSSSTRESTSGKVDVIASRIS